MAGWIIVLTMIFGMWFSKDQWNIEKFMIFSKLKISNKTTSDIYAGDLAELISNSENKILETNKILEINHKSCYLALALPEPAKTTTLKATRAISKSLALSQKLLRTKINYELNKAILKGYFVEKKFITQRKTNPCKYEGPLNFDSNTKQIVKATNSESGFKVYQDTTTNWSFYHPSSGLIWF